MRFPKHQYVRSLKLLRLIASLPCQNCGSEHMVQAAHSNQSKHGKGRGLKSSDEFAAALCLRCHYEIDQGKNLSREERQQLWENAHRKTKELLTKQGLWPDVLSAM